VPGNSAGFPKNAAVAHTSSFFFYLHHLLSSFLSSHNDLSVSSGLILPVLSCPFSQKHHLLFVCFHRRVIFFHVLLVTFCPRPSHLARFSPQPWPCPLAACWSLPAGTAVRSLTRPAQRTAVTPARSPTQLSVHSRVQLSARTPSYLPSPSFLSSTWSPASPVPLHLPLALSAFLCNY